MSIHSHVSLIDLSKQIPFEIDSMYRMLPSITCKRSTKSNARLQSEMLKKKSGLCPAVGQHKLIGLDSILHSSKNRFIKEEICFGETLIISCGHYEGDIGDEESESDFTCEESTETEESSEAKETALFEVKDYVQEDDKVEEEEEDDDDFFFYFFPDCNKPPPPQNSKTSIIVQDGLPKINPAAKSQIYCRCFRNKAGECPCYIKLPCQCGAKTKATCTCSELKEICVCSPGYPQTVCQCKSSDACLCDPDGKIFPICTCNAVDKPCICHSEKFPSPVCKCKHKPKLSGKKSKPETIMEENYAEAEEGDYGGEGESEQEPCDCQKPDPKPVCYCAKGKPCTCKEICTCDIQKSCVCDPEQVAEIQCKPDDEKLVCSCKAPKICTCINEAGGVCNCFPVNVCTCQNPKECKCFTTCDCMNPCVCDTTPVKQDECVCLKIPNQEQAKLVCTCACKKESSKKIKRVRAGREGYRWCHEIDPFHTYFDYSYNKHEDIVNAKEQKQEKVKIMGLDYGMSRTADCPIHGPEIPKFEKKFRKPSIDCCSSVGGMSISVETLGEDKDKFLVQVISYSSKEGAKTGSKLVSILDCNLHTMEENRIEHITKKDITKERRNYMAICENGYYNKVTRMCGERHVVKRFYHNFEKAHNFILEGANVILLRYLGIRRFKGTFKTETVMMDGTICESIYNCLGVSQGIVNAVPLFVTKVERHIIEPNGYIHQTLTVMTLKGCIVSHEWADNCYILHVNPLLRVFPERDEIEAHAPLRENWREDLQLMSDFLDYKTTRISEGGRYVTESGALTGTVRDYLQAILLLRPQDTLHFTRHYFGSVLSALDLPHDEFFDPSSKHVRYYFFEE